MKVILTTNIKKLGKVGDFVNVRDGFARNFLFPQKLAEDATKGKLKRLESMKAKIADEMRVQEELLAKNIESLEKAKVKIQTKGNEQGHLFQGIHKEEIREALSEQAHIDIRADMIELEHPIKAFGEFDIKVKVVDKVGQFKLSIDPIK